MSRLDHVVLHVGPEPVLRSKNRGKLDPWLGRQPIGDVAELAVDRRRVADDSDAETVERMGVEETF
jgi:hypothetical protein